VTRFEFTPPSPAFAGLLSVLLVRDPHVEVTASTIEVRLGWAFTASIPRAAVTTAVPDDRSVWGWGAHTSGRGRWLVNTSSKGLVRLSIDPAVRARTTGIPVSLRELRVSLADRDAFLAALT